VGSVPQEVAAEGAGLEPTLDGEAVAQAGRVLDYARRGKTWADRSPSVKLILALAMPTLVDQMLSAGIGITDTVVAGHTGATEELRAAAAAAVGTMTYLQWFAGLMTAALGVGATAIIARSIGAHRPRVATRVAGTVCTASFLVGLVVAAIFYVFAEQVVYGFGLREQASVYGAQYLRIMSVTICFQTLGQIGMACLRGAGDTMRPMLVTAAITVVNGLASPALAFGWFGLPAMGVRGNAIGTLLAFALAGLATVALLISGSAGLRLRRRHFRLVPHVLVRVLRIGMPSWLEGMLLWGGQALIVVLVINPTDKARGVDGVTMAAHNAVLRVESLAFLPGFGFGMACSALVGQYLGAKKPGEARHAALLCRRLAVTTMTVAALPMVFVPWVMLRLMVDSDAVVATGLWPLVLAGLAQPGFAIAIAMSSALRGAGETVAPMMSTISGMVIRLVLVLSTAALFAHLGHAAWGLVAVWIAIFVDLNYRAVFTGIVFARGKWMEKIV